MHADSHPDVKSVRPSVGAHRPLGRQGGLECRRGVLERREDVVTAGGRLATAGRPDRASHHTADIFQEGGVTIAEAPEQLGRAFEVGEQDRPFESTYANALSGSCARSFALSGGMRA
jgi:hypothetical protein